MKFRRWYVYVLIVCVITLGIFSWHTSIKHNINNNKQEITRNQDALPQKPEPDEQEEQKKEPVDISLVAVGDDLMHLEVINDFKKSDGSYDFTPLYSDIKDEVSSADIAFINQETILGGTKLGLSGYPTFNSPQELGRDLIKVGFNVINHATNHALDKGVKGINNTISFWRSHPEVTMVGIYESQEDRDTIRVVDKKGIKIAFLSYAYGTNGIPIPKGKPYIVNIIDKNLIANDVKRAKELADAVIVSLHWGNEYQEVPSKQQKELASYLADLGVTLIIGHHPHVLEPVEWMKGKDGNNMLVAYSLGNLVSCQNEIPRLVGGMLKLNIEKDVNDRISIKNPEIIPVVTHYERYAKGFRIYKLKDYTDSLAKAHGLNRLGKHVTVQAFKNEASAVLKSWYNLK